MKQYFIIKLHNAVYNFQLLSGKTGLCSVYSYRPCCIAENGFILGVNDACDKYNIKAHEPLNEALLKCADLYAEEPRLDILKSASASFFEICSRFGITKEMSFDECLLEVEELSKTDIHPLTSAIREALLDELKIESDVKICSDYSRCINKYSASVSCSDYSIELLSELLSFKLSVDNSCAKLFSLETKDSDGKSQTIDRRVDLPCGDYTLIHFVLKNMLDLSAPVESITANLYDVSIKQEIAVQSKPASIEAKQRKVSSWDYAKQNKRLSDIINGNELFVYEKLCKYVNDNPDSLSFSELCALAEKANTRRIKQGSYYMPMSIVMNFVKRCDALCKENVKVLINGCCPFSLIFFIKDYCKAELFYSGMDERTVKLIKHLETHSPYRPLELAPAVDMEYDIAVSDDVSIPYNSRIEILLVKKQFFASEKRKQISSYKISNIYDFGNDGYVGTFDQLTAIVVNKNALPDNTELVSLDNDFEIIQRQEYITDNSLPCWVLYRNEKFDSIYSKLQFDLFDVQCSSQIKQRDYSANGDVCVISAACISGDGKVNIESGCRHVVSSEISKYEVSRYVDRDDIFFAAAKSSVLKVARKPKGCIPNPSTVLLIPKDNVNITLSDLNYFSSDEFKYFYNVALNHQNFILSADHLSKYFLGKVVS